MSAEIKPGLDIFTELEAQQNDDAKLRWTGTLADYFEKLAKKPQIVRTSHQLLLDAIRSRPDFFEKGPAALYGMDRTTSRLREVLEAGAKGLEIGKRILLFVGPPGGGKTTLVNGLKRGLEDFTATNKGETYAIDGCPMHEEPLHLIPRPLRQVVEDRYNVHIDGDLCPHCVKEHGDKSMGDLRNVGVKRVVFSENLRVGIGTFKPSDPKSQDITELVGSVDFSRLPDYGSSSDPRAFRFDGELEVANRGLMEFVEMLKVDDKFLYALLDLAQDRVIKPPRFANISADEVVIAHTNEAEYAKFTAKKENEAMKDRIVVIPVPYNLRVSDEVKVYDKLVRQGNLGVHLSPQTLRVAATFAVLSRLEAPKKVGVTKMTKAKIYDGENIEAFTDKDREALQKEFPREGMEGVSPRFIIDSLSVALIKEGRRCLDPLDTLRALRDNLDSHPHTRDLDETKRLALEGLIHETRQDYDEAAKKAVQRAFVYSFTESADGLFKNYADNIDAYLNNTKIEDPLTGEDHDPDEKLMRSIEEQIGIPESGKKGFRDEVTRKILAVVKRGQKFDYTSHPRLREAIEMKLFADLQDVIKITTNTKNPDPDQVRRTNQVIDRLVNEGGYCTDCANSLVRYVGTLLNR